MNTKTLAFIGPPGSGKGTQAKLVADFLREDSDREVLYVETGSHFRKLAESESETGQMVKEALRVGEVLPAFLATSFWAQAFSGELNSDIHLVLDGSPRSKLEAAQLGEALKFYNRAPTTMFHLPISEDETRKRLAGRHRSDDEAQIIDVRLVEYHKKTKPAIDYSKESDDFTLVTINGEQSVEAIQSEIQQILTND